MAAIKPGFAAHRAPSKTLKLYNAHTDETVFAAFEENGELVPAALQQLNYLLRDHRQDEICGIDLKLFQQLHELQERLGVNPTIEVLSGYRSPKTNAMLRQKSNGVAKKSYHMVGRAIDIRIRGVDTKSIRNTALEMSAGGVGYYRSSDIVHLDTGPVRNW